MGKAAQLSSMAGAPAFSAYAGTVTSLAATAYTKVTFNTEEFDTNSTFASSRFTPNVPGYYQINSSVQMSGSVLGSLPVIYKNGAAYKSADYVGATQADPIKSISGLVYLNGSTDYVEIFVYNGSASPVNTVAAATSTWFDGHLVRAA
jgi:hypothetical protein